MATTPNYGWTLPTVGADDSTWGTVTNALFDDIDAQVKANQDAINDGWETGDVKIRLSTTASSAWVACDGTTIGNSSSGANRPNNSYEALFEFIWTNTSNTDYHVQDSSGTATTRGASAAADWAANKRMPLPDMLGRFARGLDQGAGRDAGRTLGSYQADAMQDYSSNLGLIFPGGTTNGGWSKSGGSGVYSGAGAVAPQASFSLSATSARTANETRPMNIAFCWFIHI